MKTLRMSRELLCCLVLALVLPSASAASTKKIDKEQRRTQTLLRKAEQEKKELEQQKSEVEGQLKQTQGELAENKRKASGQVTGLRRSLDLVTTEKEAVVVKLTTTEKLLAEAVAKLRQVEADKQNMEKVDANQQKALALCGANNMKLYENGRELLAAYEQKSCGDALKQSEPLTGLKRVEIENLMEKYRDKLDELKLKPPLMPENALTATP